MALITHFKLHSQCLAWFEPCTITLGTKKQKFSMRIHSLFYGALLGLWLCLFAVSFCHASSGNMHFGYLDQYFNFYNVFFYYFYLDCVINIIVCAFCLCMCCRAEWGREVQILSTSPIPQETTPTQAILQETTSPSLPEAIPYKIWGREAIHQEAISS